MHLTTTFGDLEFYNGIYATFFSEDTVGLLIACNVDKVYSLAGDGSA